MGAGSTSLKTLLVSELLCHLAALRNDASYQWQVFVHPTGLLRYAISRPIILCVSTELHCGTDSFVCTIRPASRCLMIFHQDFADFSCTPSPRPGRVRATAVSQMFRNRTNQRSAVVAGRTRYPCEIREGVRRMYKVFVSGYPEVLLLVPLHQISAFSNEGANTPRKCCM